MLKFDQRRGWSRRHALYGLLGLQFCVWMTVQYIQLKHAGEESPLDHTRTTLLKPFFKLKCGLFGHFPPLSADDRAQCLLNQPKRFMISAREPHERVESRVSWQGQQVRVLDTKQLSQDLQLRVDTECPQHAWAYRLFLIYQHTFANLLQEFPHNEGFVIMEDDAILVNPTGFAEEVCNAQSHKLEFFSFYLVPDQQTACLYRSGTVSFYIRRQLMQQVIELPRETSCRLPIDMYLATTGPYYATMHSIVTHNSERTHS